MPSGANARAAIDYKSFIAKFLQTAESVKTQLGTLNSFYIFCRSRAPAEAVDAAVEKSTQCEKYLRELERKPMSVFRDDSDALGTHTEFQALAEQLALWTKSEVLSSYLNMLLTKTVEIPESTGVLTSSATTSHLALSRWHEGDLRASLQQAQSDITKFVCDVGLTQTSFQQASTFLQPWLSRSQPATEGQLDAELQHLQKLLNLTLDKDQFRTVVQNWRVLLGYNINQDRASKLLLACTAVAPELSSMVSPSDVHDIALASSSELLQACAHLCRLSVHETAAMSVIKPTGVVSRLMDSIIFSKAFVPPEVDARLHSLARSRELICFLREVGDNDLRNLLNAVDDHADQFVRTSNIQDYVQLQRQLSELLTDMKTSSTIEDALLAVCDIILGKNSMPLDAAVLEASIPCVNAVRRMYGGLANRSQNTRDEIGEIMRSGQIQIVRARTSPTASQHLPSLKSSTWSYSFSIATTTIDRPSHSMDYLEDLRGRALLLIPAANSVLSSSTPAEDDLENDDENENTFSEDEVPTVPLREYVAIVDACRDAVDALEGAAIIGTPLDHIQFPLTVSVTDILEVHNLAIDVLQGRDFWTRAWREALLCYPEMRYFHPQHLLSVEAFLRASPQSRQNIFKTIVTNSADNVEIESMGARCLIAAIDSQTNALDQLQTRLKSKDFNWDTLIAETRPSGPSVRNDDCRVHMTLLAVAIQKCLDGLLWLARPSVVKCYNQLPDTAKARLAPPFSPARTQLQLLQDARNMVGAVLLGHLEHKILPTARSILFCNASLDWPSLELFVHRALLPQSPDTTGILPVFYLVFPEALPLHLQTKLIELLDKLMRHTDSAVDATARAATCARLILLCLMGPQSEPIQRMVDETNRRLIEPTHADILRAILALTSSNVRVITSRFPGLGKTELTHELAARTKATTVSLSGRFELMTFLSALHKTNPPRNGTLHLNMSQIHDPIAAELVLFQLLIVQGIYNPNLHLNEDLTFSQYIIELGNPGGLEGAKAAYTFLPLFSCDELTGDAELIPGGTDQTFKFFIPEDPCHALRVVCAYLHLLKIRQVGVVELSFPPTPEKPINDAQRLPVTTCRALLNEYFYQKCDNRFFSYNVLNVFVRVLASQLLYFSRSCFFMRSLLKEMLDEGQGATVLSQQVSTVREAMVSNLIALSRDFAVQSVVTAQTARAASSLQDDLERMVDQTEQRVTWDKSHACMIVFNSSNTETIMPIFRHKDDLPPTVLSLLEKQLPASMREPLSLHQLSPDKLVERLLRVVCSCAPSEFEPRLREFQGGGYVLSLDNFVKMVLIMLRIRARVPVILMGESGCGKTSLLNKLAILANAQFIVMSVHSGTTAAEVEAKINEIEEMCSASATKVADENGPRFWLFFDEFNTSEAVGLIADLVGHRLKPNGQPVHPDVVLLAACNPYRLRKSGLPHTGGLEVNSIASSKTNTDPMGKLIYRVHPMPDTLADYVWDYGILPDSEEKQYIESMCRQTLREFDRDVQEAAAKLLHLAQAFVRSQQDGWSVSLRDVRRCLDLACWFKTTRPTQSPAQQPSGSRFGFLYPKSKQDPYMSDKDMEWRSLALALAICYRSRLHEPSNREGLLKTLHTAWRGNRRINELIDEEERAYADVMDVGKGVAKNAALREMLFVTFVCILNRIPLFIVDRPGTGKSLTMSIINASCRGRDSQHEFLRKLPALAIVPYQGSASSTSEGILRIFEKAQDAQRRQRQETGGEDILAVVLLDEVGLAEVSPHNPLKVLHALLEPATGQRPDVAVIGISNWALDPAKMSRAIHLSRPGLTHNDLVDTAKAIFCAQLGKNTLQRSDEHYYLESCAGRYNAYLKGPHGRDNFHGLRDFYGLVKSYARAREHHNARSFSSIDSSQTDYIMAVQRNFGGRRVDRGTDPYHGFLTNINSDRALPISELIKQNMDDISARHLMLIASDVGGEALAIDAVLKAHRSILDEQRNSQHIAIVDESLKPPRVFYGSKFADDNCDKYRYAILSEVIVCMETGRSVIFVGHHSIFSSLYDMLNQKYTTVNGRNHCRIALGSSANPMCFVHARFRCIVVMSHVDVMKADRPFINRFEKHRLEHRDFLRSEALEVSRQAQKWISLMTRVSPGSGTEWPFNESSLIVGHRGATQGSATSDAAQATFLIEAVVMREIEKNGLTDSMNTEPRQLLEAVQRQLLLLATVDGVLRIPASALDAEHANRALEIYFKGQGHDGLIDFLQRLTRSEGINGLQRRQIILTFSPVLTSNVDRDFCAFFGGGSTTLLRLGAVKSEGELTAQMVQFAQHPTKTVFVLQVDAWSEQDHLHHALFLLDEYVPIVSSGNKSVFVVIHIMRDIFESADQFHLALLPSWEYITMDSLGSSSTQTHEIAIAPIINLSVADVLFRGSTELPLDEFMSAALRHAIVSLPYPSTRAWRNRPDELWRALQANPLFRKTLFDVVRSIIIERERSDDTAPGQWLVDLALDNRQLILHRNLATSARYALVHHLRATITEILIVGEKWSGFDVGIVTNGESAVAKPYQGTLWAAYLKKILDAESIDGARLPSALTLPPSGRGLSCSFPFAPLILYRLRQAHDKFTRVHLHRTEEDTTSETPMMQLDSIVHHLQGVLNQLLTSFQEDVEVTERINLVESAEAQDDLRAIILEHVVDHIVQQNTLGNIDATPRPGSPLFELLLRIADFALSAGACVDTQHDSLVDALVKFWLHETRVQSYLTALWVAFAAPAISIMRQHGKLELFDAKVVEGLDGINMALEHAKNAERLGETNDSSNPFDDVLIRQIAQKMLEELTSSPPLSDATIRAAQDTIFDRVSSLNFLRPQRDTIAGQCLLTMKAFADIFDWWKAIPRKASFGPYFAELCQTMHDHVDQPEHLWLTAFVLMEKLGENVVTLPQSARLAASLIQRTVGRPGVNTGDYLKYIARMSTTVQRANGQAFHPFVWPLRLFVEEIIQGPEDLLGMVSIEPQSQPDLTSLEEALQASLPRSHQDSSFILDDSHFAVAILDAFIDIDKICPFELTDFTENISTVRSALETICGFTSGKITQVSLLSVLASLAIVCLLFDQLAKHLDEFGRATNTAELLHEINVVFERQHGEATHEALILHFLKKRAQRTGMAIQALVATGSNFSSGGLRVIEDVLSQARQAREPPRGESGAPGTRLQQVLRLNPLRTSSRSRDGDLANVVEAINDNLVHHDSSRLRRLVQTSLSISAESYPAFDALMRYLGTWALSGELTFEEHGNNSSAHTATASSIQTAVGHAMTNMTEPMRAQACNRAATILRVIAVCLSQRGTHDLEIQIPFQEGDLGAQSLVYRFACVLATQVAESSVFAMLFHHPEEATQLFLPAQPPHPEVQKMIQVILAGGESGDMQITRYQCSRCRAPFYVHNCGARGHDNVAGLPVEARCTSCQTTVAGGQGIRIDDAPVTLNSVENASGMTPTPGYVDDEPELLRGRNEQYMRAWRGLGPLAFRIIHQAVYASLAAGYFWGHHDGQRLSRFFNSNPGSPRISPERAVTLCLTHIRNDWTLLQCGVATANIPPLLMLAREPAVGILAFLHSTAERLCAVSAENTASSSCSTAQLRAQHETALAQAIQTDVSKVAEIVREYVLACREPLPGNGPNATPVRMNINEELMEEWRFIDNDAYRRMRMPRLLRIRPIAPANLDNAIASVNQQLTMDHASSQRNGFLKLLAMHWSGLKTAGRIRPLLQFSRHVRTSLSNHLRREDRTSMTMEKFLREHGMLRQEYNAFEAAWNSCYPDEGVTLGCTRDRELPMMSKDQFASMALAFVDNESFFLCALLSKLAQRQSNFIREVYELAREAASARQSTASSALQYLNVSSVPGDALPIPSRRIVELSLSRDIIDLECQEDELFSVFSYSFPSLRCGNTTEYLLDIIESELAQRILGRRPIIQATQDDFPAFIFRGEALNDSKLLTNVSAFLMPTPTSLPLEMKKRLVTDLARADLLSRDLLDTLMVTMVHVDRIRPDDAQTTTLTEFSAKFLPSSDHSLLSSVHGLATAPLRNLVLIFEVIEEAVGDRLIQLLPEPFCVRLPHPNSQALTETLRLYDADEVFTPICLVAVKRCVYRRFLAPTSAVDHSCPLKVYLESDPQLWSSVFPVASGNTWANETAPVDWMSDRISDAITVAHLLDFHDHLHKYLQERQAMRENTGVRVIQASTAQSTSANDSVQRTRRRGARTDRMM